MGPRPVHPTGPSRPPRPWEAPRSPAGPGVSAAGAPWSRPAARLPELPELGPDEELIAGRRPVEEAFVARREARRLLVVPQRRQALDRLVLHAASLRIPVVEVEGGSLTAIAGFDGHQGVALVVAPRQWAGIDDILALATQRSEAALVLVLDSLEDPQNLGTLLRSAEASGVHGAVFPTRRQAPLSPAAVKASAGAVEHLRLAPVDDLPGTLADLHARGLRIVGADGDAPLTAREADLRGPIAIVVGSEGRGLGPAVRRRCDLLVRIPMHGRIDSLNAAVAGSILLYEAAAQRGTPEAPARAADEARSETSTQGADRAGEEEAGTDQSVDDAPAGTPAATDPVTEAPTARRRRARAAADAAIEAPAARRRRAPAAPRRPATPESDRPEADGAPAGNPADDLLPGDRDIGPAGSTEALDRAADHAPDASREGPAKASTGVETGPSEV